MSRFPESFTAMKEVAPGASLTDGKQTTRPFLTNSETGSALEKQDGNPSKTKGRIAPAFFCGLPGKLNRAGSIYWSPFFDWHQFTQQLSYFKPDTPLSQLAPWATLIIKSNNIPAVM